MTGVCHYALIGNKQQVIRLIYFIRFKHALDGHLIFKYCETKLEFFALLLSSYYIE